MQVFPALKAIKEKCLDCACWNREEVRQCPTVSCSLWAWRFGKKPSQELVDAVRKAEPLPEQAAYRQALAQSSAKMKERMKAMGLSSEEIRARFLKEKP